MHPLHTGVGHDPPDHTHTPRTHVEHPSGGGGKRYRPGTDRPRSSHERGAAPPDPHVRRQILSDSGPTRRAAIPAARGVSNGQPKRPPTDLRSVQHTPQQSRGKAEGRNPRQPRPRGRAPTQTRLPKHTGPSEYGSPRSVRAQITTGMYGRCQWPALRSGTRKRVDACVGSGGSSDHTRLVCEMLEGFSSPRCSYTRVSSVIATHWYNSLACGRPRPVEKDTYGSVRTRTRPEETVDLFVGYPEYNTTGGR